MKSLIILTFQANEDMAKDLEEAEEELERMKVRFHIEYL